jgi:aldehyde:ferredoxin oxidoreductase
MGVRFSGGYAGKYLEVDLSKGQISVGNVDPEFAETFVGGRGFSSKIQYDELGPGADPLGPENILLVCAGPLCGTPAPGGNRVTIGAKSPLTGILGDSHIGGSFGSALKSAGYDYIVVRGRAEKPQLLVIEDDRVELRDASGLWGKDTFEIRGILDKEFGKGFDHIGIGQGGENLVPFASIVSKEMRAAGRTGMGAVMGSKNLKAVVVRGTKKARVGFEDETREARDHVLGLLRSDPFVTEVASRLGTSYLISASNQKGALSTKNWRESVFKDAEKISGETIMGRYLVREHSCRGCTLRCSKIVQVPSGEFATEPTKIEYFGICGFGSNLGNSNPEAIIKAYELCNRWGIDVGEAQGVLAFAFECYERDLLGKGDTDGIELRWGNSSTIPVLLRKIAFREGFGAVLAKGIRGCSEEVGGGSEKFAMHIKGMGMDVGDARVFKTYWSRLRVASRGGDHLRGQGPGGYLLDSMALADGVREVMYNEAVCALSDMMGVCKFPYGLYSSTRELFKEKITNGLVKVFSSIVGRHYTWDELALKAERVLNVERVVNTRKGLGREDDQFPKRFLEEPVSDGPAKGRVYDISDEWIEEYYRQRGWDLGTGIPTEEKLRELGLEDVWDMSVKMRG